MFERNRKRKWRQQENEPPTLQNLHGVSITYIEGTYIQQVYMYSQIQPLPTYTQLWNSEARRE